MRASTARRKGKSEVWRFDKFGTNASYVKADDCSSAGGSIDDSEELATAAVRFLSGGARSRKQPSTFVRLKF